jgi:hypothetical protein
MNLVIVRENEEDLYAGIEHRQTREVHQSLKLISRPGTERIVRFAFAYARAYGRRKVTCMTKDNIMKLTDGLFHRTFDAVAAEYPDLEAEHLIIDIGAARLADTPERFDVIVTLNLYGDVLSDVASQVAGSVGWAARPTSATASRCSRRCTAARPTSPAATSPTPRHAAGGRPDAGARRPGRRRQRDRQRLAAHAGGRRPHVLGRQLETLAGPEFTLSLVTNRGVKVYPQGLPQTLCTDHWRCRFPAATEGSATPRSIAALLLRLADAGLNAVKTENLYTFDGERGYSQAQGE